MKDSLKKESKVLKPKVKNKRKNKIALPKIYLSWSALSIFKRSPQQYMECYFYGKRGYESLEMDFGKEFATFMESGKEHPDKVVDIALKSIPRLPLSEVAITSKLTSEWGPIPLLGKLDRYDPKTHAFDEYKTGRRKWTATMTQNHGQMKFYALILWLNHGVIDQKKNLVWIETENTDEGIRPTGRIETYPVIITLSDILIFAKEVTNIAKQITDLYQKEINNIVV